MLSKYTWGDLFLFLFVAAVIYYAFVIIKYYREDIREWISNRGSAPKPVSTQSDPDDDDDVDIYSTTTYSAPAKAVEPPVVKPVQEPSAVVYSQPNLPDGPVASEEVIVGFDVAGIGEVVRPKERSLASILNAAGKLRSNSDGTVTAEDSADEDASDLAGIINDQKGLTSVLTGVSFKR